MRCLGRATLLMATMIFLVCLPATPAAASNDTIEPDTGTVGVEHVTIRLATGTVKFQVGSMGFVSCNGVSGEGTIDDFVVEEGFANENGAIEALDFLQGGNQECPATGLPVSSCNPTISTFPLDVRVNEISNEVLVINVEIILGCESLIGTVFCHYNAPQIDGGLALAANEVAVFGTAAGDDVFTGEGSNSFLCPASGQLQGSLELRTESAPIQEVSLDEIL
jgi:hypothetical protein